MFDERRVVGLSHLIQARLLGPVPSRTRPHAQPQPRPEGSRVISERSAVMTRMDPCVTIGPALHWTMPCWQLGNGRACSRSQQLRLWRLRAYCQKPAAQSLPSFAPCSPAFDSLILLIADISRGCVSRFTLGDLQEDAIDMRRQVLNQLGDGVRATGQ